MWVCLIYHHVFLYYPLPVNKKRGADERYKPGSAGSLLFQSGENVSCCFNMINAVTIVFFLPFAATLTLATECGRDGTVPDPNRPAIILRFLVSSRNGSAPMIGGIRVNRSLPIAFLDPDGVTRDPMGFIGEISWSYPEVRYMHQYEKFFKTLREERNDYRSEIVFEIVCRFVPCLERCRIVHRIDERLSSSTYIFWNETEPTVRHYDPDDPGNSTSTLRAVPAHRRVALGTSTDPLRKGAMEVYERWSDVYTRILNTATAYSSSFIFEYNPEHPRDVVCQLRTAAPLSFFLVLEGPDMKPIVSEEAIVERECTAVTIANVIPPEDYDLDQLTCKIMSPLGWNVSIKGPKRVYPKSWSDGIVKEYRPWVRLYYPRTTSRTTFVSMTIVCALMSFVFSTLVMIVANVLVTHYRGTKTTRVTRPPPETGLCDRCKKKAY